MPVKKPPSMRGKRHYLVFRVISDSELRYPEVKNAVWNSVMNWLGEDEVAKSNVHIIRNLWDQKEQTGFIACSPRYMDSLKISLALVHQIGDSRVILQSLRVSGTIKSAKRKIKKR